MKYFGKGSVSSFFSIFLGIAWYMVLVVAIGGGLFYSAVIQHGPVEKFVTEQMAKEHAQEKSADTLKDMEDWEKFKAAPLALKLLGFPYVAAIVVFLLLIIKKSKQVFDNFRKDIVFDRMNVDLIKAATKLTIVFSILTFNFSGLLTCIMLFMLAEIFKNASALQEEHNLTV